MLDCELLKHVLHAVTSPELLEPPVEVLELEPEVVGVPHTVAHDRAQALQPQESSAWSSLTAVEPAVIAHELAQVLFPGAHVPRQLLRFTQLASLLHALVWDEQAPDCEPTKQLLQASVVPLEVPLVPVLELALVVLEPPVVEVAGW